MKVGGKILKTFGVDAFPFLSVSGPPNSLSLSSSLSISESWSSGQGDGLQILDSDM